MLTQKCMRTPKTRQLGYRIFPELMQDFDRSVDSLAGHVRGQFGGDPSQANVVEMFLAWFCALEPGRRIDLVREMRSAYWEWTAATEMKAEKDDGEKAGGEGGGENPPPKGGRPATGLLVPLEDKGADGGGVVPEKGAGAKKQDKRHGGKPRGR